MIVSNSCSACLSCLTACPKAAIEIKKDKLGFSYAHIEESKCVECGICDSLCPEMQGTFETTDVVFEKKFYAAKNTDDLVRKESSSGGVFTALATAVLSEGGFVVGASMDENGYVSHVMIDRVEEIPMVTKTKYVQSDTLGIHDRVMEKLKNGCPVLFAGTPCQVEAMRLRADQYRERLYLIDLICYGVPSPEVWGKYIKLLERKYKGKLSAFFFRDKRNNDDGHTAVAVVDGVEHAYSLYGDMYCTTYFRNINIRKSCGECRFTTLDRKSDITIGDFWGVEKRFPELNDGKGTSVVIVHSEKGARLLDRAKDNLSLWACEAQDVMQPRLESATVLNPKRDFWVWLYKKVPFKVWLKLIYRKG